MEPLNTTPTPARPRPLLRLLLLPPFPALQRRLQHHLQQSHRALACLPSSLWHHCHRLLDDASRNIGLGKSCAQDLLARIPPPMVVTTTTPQRHGVGHPPYACISASLPNRHGGDGGVAQHLFDIALSAEQVAQRLDGIPVYTVCNSANEFVLVSDLNNQRSLGVFCLRHDDAEALLRQIRDREPHLGRGAKVIAVSLNKVYKLNTEGIAFRFLPDPRQVKNALETRAKAGDSAKAFDGVPIFQSDNLILRSNNKRFCPIFFCKEDLEQALQRAFKQQQKVNPSLRVNTEIQVGSFEDVLKRMESSDDDSDWGDVVFIPPGMDAIGHLGKALSQTLNGSTVLV